MTELKIELPPLAIQDAFVAQKKALEKIKAIVEHLDDDGKNGRTTSDSWKEFKRGYTPPSPEEVREAFKPHTGAQIANLLGLGEARTVRRWIGGDAQIPYAAWRLYLILTGRVLP